MTADRLARMIAPMQLSATLQWLIDEAHASPDADHFLAGLGARLIDDGLPLAGGALDDRRAAPDHRPAYLALASR